MLEEVNQVNQALQQEKADLKQQIQELNVKLAERKDVVEQKENDEDQVM